jgi:6-pyruvoyltetrahydropterin/6-carboxytetrahydropterin synthase
MKFQSTKLFDGFSTCFRQWKADSTHCKYLHGYAVSFRVWFEGDLDERNWVWDFGGMKRAKHKIGGKSPKDFFTYLLDHTTIVASDDPYLDKFVQMDKDGIIQLRVLPATGCERFAEYLYRQINRFLKEETKGRVRAIKVEVYEHDRNSASYMETQNTTKKEEMLSLYDYLGRPAGSELGKKVAEVATKLKVSINVREVQTKTYKGQVLLYPKSFLESYFKPKTVTPELVF